MVKCGLEEQGVPMETAKFIGDVLEKGLYVGSV